MARASLNCRLAGWSPYSREKSPHATFALLNQSEPSLEHWLRVKTHSPVFSTVYPASWQAEPAHVDARDCSGLHLRLIDAKGKTMLAYLVVKAERNPFPQPIPVPELLSDARRMLEGSGIAITSTPEAIPAQQDPRAAAVRNWLGGYTAEARLGTADIDLRLGFVARGDMTFTLAACSPKPEDDTLVALRTQRAFEIVRAGLERD